MGTWLISKLNLIDRRVNNALINSIADFIKFLSFDFIVSSTKLDDCS